MLHPDTDALALVMRFCVQLLLTHVATTLSSLNTVKTKQIPAVSVLAGTTDPRSEVAQWNDQHDFDG